MRIFTTQKPKSHREEEIAVSIWRWNNFTLAGDGNFLRSYAKEHNLFLYPYDILTGSDIALFENINEKAPEKRYIVCTTAEMKPQKTSKNLYHIVPSHTMAIWDSVSASSYEGAVALWNKRTQTTAKRILKSFPWRFWAMEHSAIWLNSFTCFVVFFLLAINNSVYHFLTEHTYLSLAIFFLLCSNIENIFTKSYGEEMPREIVERWAGWHADHFIDNFYMDAMQVWPEIKRRHENSIPIYLMWKRGKLRPPVNINSNEEVAGLIDASKETEYTLYCQEIRDSLRMQIGEISDQRTKISDKTIKGYVENILKILKEIQQAISAETASQKIISARRVVSYWNEETISLLQNYTQLLNNSSDEATETKIGIEAILKDLPMVYKKELGRITETSTMEIKASLSVIRNEIDQVLNDRI